MKWLLKYFVYFFIVTFTSSLKVRHTHRQKSVKLDFLLLRDAFSTCSKPTILATKAMDVTTLEVLEKMKGQVQQYCTEYGDKCTYCAWDSTSGTAHICPTNDFVKAEPRYGWIISAKVTSLVNDSSFSSIPNVQLICSEQLDQHISSSIKQAIQKCEELKCDSFTINLNKAKALSPSVAPLTTVFCKGIKHTFHRNGFLTLQLKSLSSFVHDPTPTLPTGVKVPCGLNGPICSNDYVKGHQQGEIIADKPVPMTRPS